MIFMIQHYILSQLKVPLKSTHVTGPDPGLGPGPGAGPAPGPAARGTGPGPADESPEASPDLDPKQRLVLNLAANIAEGCLLEGTTVSLQISSQSLNTFQKCTVFLKRVFTLVRILKETIILLYHGSLSTGMYILEFPCICVFVSKLIVWTVSRSSVYITHVHVFTGVL